MPQIKVTAHICSLLMQAKVYNWDVNGEDNDPEQPPLPAQDARPHQGSGALLLSSFLLTETKNESIITCRVNRTPSISLWCDCRELLLFAGVQLTRLLAHAFRPPIYISGQCSPARSHWHCSQFLALLHMDLEKSIDK